MAIYRFEAKIVSRSGGRSTLGAAAYRTGKCATASAAYRAGAVLIDERTGQRFDYSRMRGVVGAEIMAPADAPAWMLDRSRLWNTVEAIEKRYDAQLARDFVISLPHELPHEVRAELTRAFVKEQFVDKGFVADIAWHAPERGGDRRNQHAHVMVPMRKVDREGFAKRKDRPPPGEHPSKRWKIDLEALRFAWAQRGADALERAGLHCEAERFRAGYMTLDKQREAAIERGDLAWADALDREPEPKQGPLATKMEKEGKESHAGDDRRATKQRNAELAALKVEHAQVTAEIISLELERLKRGHMDDIGDDALKTQPEREAELLEQAKKREAEFAEFRRRKEEEAKEARRLEEERKRAEQVRARQREITDPRARYAQAIADNYSASDPYGSLAQAALAEYKEFAKRQDEYRKLEAAELDPDKRRIIQLSRQIEAHEYMAITSERCAHIGGILAGHDAEKRAKLDGRTTDMERDRKWAAAYRERGKELREQRSELISELATRTNDRTKEESPSMRRKAESREGEMTDRGAERLSKLQGVGAVYAQTDGGAAARSRQRGGWSR